MARVQFDWQDPLNFNSLLTEEERMIRDMVHEYAQDKLMARVDRKSVV